MDEAPPCASQGKSTHSVREQLATCLDQLGGSGATDVTIDLGEVPFIDSAGLRVLVGAALRLQEAGGRLELANVSKGTRRLFEITGLIQLLMP